MTPGMSRTAADRRVEWGSKHGWSLFVLLGAALLGLGLWALSEDRPALAGVPTALGGGFLTLALYLSPRRS
jgi:uncharacterized membrane protein HdeD (DUF308 family)